MPDGSAELYVVLRVVDGDTIRVDLHGADESVRLIGIDTPETGAGRTVVECFGREASDFARRMMDGQRVRLAADPTQDDRDHYGRLLRYVWLEDGTFVNERMVAEGYAFEYTYDEPYQHRDALQSAETNARSTEVGLWAATACGDTPEVSGVGGAEVPVTPETLGIAAPQPSQEPAASVVTDVVIASIDYDGEVPRVESDEHVVITNGGSSPVNLRMWRLNAGDDGQDFWFPDLALAPGESCHVYTNQVGPEACSLSFGSGKALWNNDGDCGYLLDATGTEVSRFCYR